jgi:anaerobic magnesium-protoporphyrin IX monomethyl ester cyclase
LGYLAAYLKKHNVSIDLVDCTFLSQKEALEKIRRSRPRIIGIYAMFTMKRKAIEMARLLRGECELLVTGGPLPTSHPEDFLRDFDVVVVGEGEETLLELVAAVENGFGLADVKGVVYREDGEVKRSQPRAFIQNLDSVPFPAREFFDDRAYKEYYSRNFGYTITSVMTSRGCPFNCDFCSRPVFGNIFRSRSAANIVDEMEVVCKLGYDRIWFADDCFTLDRRRLVGICDEIVERSLKVGWECLSRADTVDEEVAEKMRQAGCVRVYFGIESGNDQVLRLMNKSISVEQARRAVHITKNAGIQVGAFFILGYPGESEEMILDTVRFASSLPLDYLSFTFPYPIPGTPLYERVNKKMNLSDWEEPRSLHLIKHKLLFSSSFSEAKLKFAIAKAMTQFYIRKYLKTNGYRFMGTPFEKTTDFIFKLL